MTYTISNEIPAPPDDHRIVQSILAGKTADFEILLGRYRGYVFKILSGLVPENMVQELAQDVFIEIFSSLPRYQEQTVFKKWVAGITIHLAYDFWRTHYRNREIPLSSLNEEHQEWLETVIDGRARKAFDGNESRKEARELLQLAMAELSPEDRMVLTLVHLEGFSVKETAVMLNWSTINVKVRAYRSREKMRKRIAAMLEGAL